MSAPSSKLTHVVIIDTRGFIIEVSNLNPSSPGSSGSLGSSAVAPKSTPKSIDVKKFCVFTSLTVPASIEANDNILPSVALNEASENILLKFAAK